MAEANRDGWGYCGHGGSLLLLMLFFRPISCCGCCDRGCAADSSSAVDVLMVRSWLLFVPARPAAADASCGV
jgi:hypothetical protein